MSSTIGTWRTTLQTRAATISGLRAYAKWPPGEIRVPAFIVVPDRRVLDTLGGGRTLHFKGLLLVGSVDADAERSQDALDAYLEETGSTSIIAALEGTDGQIEVVGWSNYGKHEISEEVAYWGVDVEIEVLD